MRIKLIVSLLLVCLAFSLGFAQAQMQGNNTSQNMSQNASQNMSQNMQNMSQQGNMNMPANVPTVTNKTVIVSQQAGEDVKWILPGPRRLDPQIFGTPDSPLGFEPVIGVPIENRSVSGNMFTNTSEPTPFSDNFTRINGSFNMYLVDDTPVDVNQSNDTAQAQFNFTDPTGQIQYRVVLTNITRVGEFHPVFGGVVVDGIAHGKTGIDTRMEPTSYVYGAVWGTGALYINDTLVSDNRTMHAMAAERLRSLDEQGYRLLLDNELPHSGIQVELLLPDMVMAENGTMQKLPVPTNYTLPNGQEQPFIHIAFDNPQLQGLEILNFNNATMNMSQNMTGNMSQNMTQNNTNNMTGNMSQQNMTGNMTQNQNMTGNMTQNMTGTDNNTGTGGTTGGNDNNAGNTGANGNNADDNTGNGMTGDGSNNGGNTNTGTTDDNSNNPGDDNSGGAENS